MKTIQLAIRDFAVPVPRTGSIEVLSGYGNATAQGQEIHLLVQERRSRTEPDYEAEVKISHAFEQDGYRFEIGGRMDGFIQADPPIIEEIKTSFSLRELQKKLTDEPHHPYNLQLKTYGYFYWLQNQVVPELTFHLVSTRNSESDDLEIQLDREDYEKWLERRLDELVEEAKASEKLAKKRKKTAIEFKFPFETPRSGQVELIQTIDETLKTQEPLLVQAPTGLGKTVGVLYPVLKEALSRGNKVVYVTPKNSQHSVAEDAMKRFQDEGAKVRSLTITAKSKICFKAEPLCNPDYCEYARDHYTKVYENKLLDQLAKKKSLTSRTFRDLGEEYQVCPFELQLDAAEKAEAVICDYNYVFAPRSSFGRLSKSGIAPEGKPNLVIDEAHNLPGRAMDYYSPALSSIALEKMREDIRGLPGTFRGEAEELLDECLQVILGCRPDGAAKSERIAPPADPFLEQEGKLRGFLSRYLESDVEIRPRDVVLRLCFYWGEFTSALEFVQDPERSEFFTTFHPHPSGGTIKITCCDASEMLKSSYDEYEHVVAFSATLKPFEYYAKLSGFDPGKVKLAEFQSPFEKSNRKLLIIPQISTKYSDRARNYPRIADAIRRIAELRRGNYFAFFPSFEFLERVLEILEVPEGFAVLRQEREMKTPQVNEILEHLREGSQPTLVFAVQGGVFSEGVDYPGDMIIGAFVVGPALPSYDLERELIREYYEQNYGSGFDYAYTYPAMAKVIQSAGRVIRTETDRGLIVLMDQRFVHKSYTQSMPKDWFERSAQELVSSGILKEVSDFWEGK